jgi:beta-glucosidase/6-phospho-beta-glucosidase/beta-galactosidase
VSGRATNHYELYEQDIELVRKLNMNSFRFSIEWSRIEPEEGVWDPKEIVAYIKQNISPEATFEYYDTICRQVANRMPKLREFAATHDLIFFVSGKKS